MKGVGKVFSYTLADEAGVTPDQVRRDFSEFNIKGRKRGGYIISDELESVIYYVYKRLKLNRLKNLELLYKDMKY